MYWNMLWKKEGPFTGERKRIENCLKLILIRFRDVKAVLVFMSIDKIFVGE